MSPATTRSRRRPSPAPARALTLDIVHEAGDWNAIVGLEAAIETAAAALAKLPQLSGLPAAGGAACILLNDDAGVRALNATWRKKDKPTNVLSFPAAAPPPGADPGGDAVFLGDIVLAAETLAREAADDDVPLTHHLQHLVIHGLLHLMGHDHETEAEAETMEALEIAALAAIGVANPYDDRELAPDDGH